jgi:Cu/Ag efflux protein CusF
MTEPRPRRPVPVPAGLAGLLGCLWLGLAAAAPASFDGHGRVVAVDPASGTVTLDHAAIPGLLPATRSRFPVSPPGVLAQLRAGERVRFLLAASEESHGLLTVSSLLPEAAADRTWVGLLVPVLSGVAAVAAVVAAALAVALWRDLRALHRRVVALDHEAGMVRRVLGEVQDDSRQVAGALDQIAHTLLVGYIQDLKRRLTGIARPGGDPATGRSGGEPAPRLVIVQRGRTDVLRVMEENAAGPGIRVIWDRRRTERRMSRRSVALEHRRGERRGAPPETWATLGFLVIPDAGEPVRADAADRGSRPLHAVRGDRAPR